MRPIMTDVLLIICEALLADIVLYTGFYLLTHRNRKFLLFDPTSEPSLKIIMTIWGSLLIILGLLTILAIFIIKSIVFISIILVLDAIVEASLSFIMLIYYNTTNK